MEVAVFCSTLYFGRDDCLPRCTCSCFHRFQWGHHKSLQLQFKGTTRRNTTLPSTFMDHPKWSFGERYVHIQNSYYPLSLRPSGACALCFAGLAAISLRWRGHECAAVQHDVPGCLQRPHPAGPGLVCRTPLDLCQYISYDLVLLLLCFSNRWVDHYNLSEFFVVAEADHQQGTDKGWKKALTLTLTKESKLSTSVDECILVSTSCFMFKISLHKYF